MSPPTNNPPSTDKKNEDVAVPDDFICPLTLEIMTSPMITRWGHSFEKDALLEWMERNDACPLTRNPIKLRDVIANRSLESKIQDWKKKHNLDSGTEQNDTNNTTGGVVMFFVAKEDQERVLIEAARGRSNNNINNNAPVAKTLLGRMAHKWRGKKYHVSRPRQGPAE